MSPFAVVPRRGFGVVLVSCLLFSAPALLAQPGRIPRPVDNLRTVPLKGNRTPRAHPQDDQGRVDPLAMNVTDSSGNALSIGFALDSAQRLTAVQTTNAAGATTTQTVTEDNAGNETVFGTASYAYSPRNLLASGEGVTYTYDGFGRRVSATASAGTRTS